MAYVHPPSEPIAIIGIGCRFPGNSTSPSKLWSLLSDPSDLSKYASPTKFNIHGFFHPDGEHHGTTNARKAYWLEQDHRLFDASFFNITPKEAEAIDPQGKILLETVYEAIDSAGLSMQKCAGQDISVFVGTMTADYDLLTGKDELTFSQYCATGTSRAIISNRLSYFFNWTGPSMTIDTACSSSLVAMHQAVQSLRSGECTMSCVAGANVMLGPELFIGESNLHMLSPDGKSQMWDKGANGYARGEGVGAIMLKTLSQALKDGDHIDCIIRETGVNSDGRTKGITMPSPAAQAALIQETYLRSGLDPRNPLHRCQYFEAHGTGTQAGDPSEAEAIYTAFFGEPDSKEQIYDEHDQVIVGSIKTVIGHTEGAAGVAGVIKATLALQNKQIPPNQHLRTLNPKLTQFTSRLQVPTVLTPWPTPPKGHPARASVNSFGFGGTNSHAILERYEPEIQGSASVALWSHGQGNTQSSAIPMLLSANSDKALVRMVEKYADYLKATPKASIRDLAWTLACRRTTLPHNIAFPAADRETLIQSLDEKLAVTKANPSSEFGTRSKIAGRSGRILGIFTGQGAQWPQMGRSLIRTSPLFRRVIHGLDQVLRSCRNPPSWSVEEELLSPPSVSRLGEAALSQPLCTAIQVALVELLKESGVTFSAVVGHSSGEIGAAYAAGVVSARDAILIAYYRGFYAKLAGGRAGAEGGMMAVGMGVLDALDLCEQKEFKDRMYIAASNAPASVTLSGDLEAIELAKSQLDEQKKFARLLKVDTAYHSHHMDRCASLYVQALASYNIKINEPRSNCVWVSSVYGLAGQPATIELRGRYWRDNMVQPVLFCEALTRALIEQPPFDLAIEVGPHPALKGPATQTMQEAIAKVIPYTGVLGRGKDDVHTFSDGLSLIWSTIGAGCVRWDSFANAVGSDVTKCVVQKNLPSYPWEYPQAHFRQPRMARQYLHRTAPPHELLGVRTLDDSDSEYRWRNLLKPNLPPWLKDHRFQGQIIVPAAAYCVMALEAASAVFPEAIMGLIEIQDLIIRAGINMGDDSQGVEALFSLKREHSADGTVRALFCLDWAPVDGDMSLKNAITGRIVLYPQDGSADMLPTRSVQRPSLHNVNLDDFYSSMKAIGLGYTGPFRALVALERRSAFAGGMLQKPHPDDTCELPVRPALLDACFQAAFAAFAAPGDGLRFNPNLCKADPAVEHIVDVDAAITQFTPTTPRTPANFSGDIAVYNSSGQMEMQIECITVASFAAAAPADDRQLFLQTVWATDPWSELLQAEPASAGDVDGELVSQCNRVSDFYVPSLSGEVVDTHETISSLVASSAYRSYLELLQGCGRYLPSLMPGLAKEIVQDCQEIQSLRNQLKQTVGQITHRHPRLKVLELNLGRNSSVTDCISESLAPSFVSYTHIHDEQSSSPIYKSGVLKSQAQKVSVKMVYSEDELKEQVFGGPLYDVVIISGAGGAGQVFGEQMYAELRAAMSPGGYLITIQSEGSILQERLLQCFSTAANQLAEKQDTKPKENNLQAAGFTEPLATFFTPRSKFSLSVKMAATELTEALKAPLSAPGLFSISGPVLILGGQRAETKAISLKLRTVLEQSNSDVILAPSFHDINLSDVDGIRAAIILADLDESIIAYMDDQRLATLQRIFAPNRQVLWLTTGSREDNPYHTASVGLCRCLRAETPQLQLQLLDVDDISDAENFVAEAFLRFSLGASIEASEHLWTTETEIAIESGKLLIPRVMSLEGMNDRYNAVRRVIVQEKNVSESAVELVAENEALGVAYCAKDVPKTVAKDDEIVVRMMHSTAWAFQTEITSPLFFGVGLSSTGQNMIVAASSNASLVTIPATHAWNLPKDWPPGPSGLGLLVRYLVASAIVQDAQDGAMLFHEADSIFADIMTAVNAGCRKLHFTTNVHQRAAGDDRFLFLHPRSMKHSTRLLIPTGIQTFVDFSAEKASFMDSLPKSAVRIKPTAQLAHLAGHDSDMNIHSLPDIISRAAYAVANLKKSHEVETAVSIGCLLEAREQSIFTVVDWVSNPVISQRIQPIKPSTLLSSSNTYLMVGLTGELGQSLCKLMITHGARYIVVVSRNPDKSPAWKVELEAMGATVHIMALDATQLDHVRQLKAEIEKTLPPIKGVANGAMVLNDRLFTDMTLRQFQTVLGPKITGSRNLDLVFGETSLDFFIMFSSLTAVAGNKGQSNYAAANMYMAGLAAQRRKRGLVASVIDIGMVYGIGYINRIDGGEIYSNLKKQGYLSISEQDMHTMFIEAIAAGKTSSGTTPELITGLQRFNLMDEKPLHWHSDPRFSHHTVFSDALTHTESPGLAQTIKDLITESSSVEAVAETISVSFAAQMELMLQLKPGSANRESPIIDLGVDSLVAVEVRSWFLKEVGKDMPVLKVLGGSSIAGLSEEVAVQIWEERAAVAPTPAKPVDDSGTDVQSIHGSSTEPSSASESKYYGSSSASETSGVEVNDIFDGSFDQVAPMSYGQARMWFPYLLLSDKTTYNCTTSYHLRGSLDVPRFERAIHLVTRRNESLRSSFFTDQSSSEPIIAISRSSPFSLRKIAPSNDTEDVKVETERLAQHIFDLQRGDVFRATLLTHDDSYHTVIFGYHHILIDGVSWQLFLQDLERCYTQPEKQLPMTNDFVDFAVQQRGDLETSAVAAKRDFWKTEFATLPSAIPLFPFAKVAGRKALDQYEITEYFFELDRSLVAQVKAASTENKATPFHFYLSVFRVMLQRTLGIKELCIGITDSNRTDPSFMETIGLLLDTLPLWLKSADNETFSESLANTRNAVYSALGNSGVPLDVILDDIGAETSATELPLFQVLVNYRMGAIKQKSIGDVQLDYLSYDDAKHPFDFILTIDEDEGRGGLTLSMQNYLYGKSGADIFMETYIYLLKAFAANLSLQTTQPDIYMPELKAQAITLGTGSALSEGWKPTLAHQVDEMINRHPTDLALQSDNVEYSYKQMSSRIYNIASSLVEAGVVKGSRVAVFCEQSPDTVSALLAIMRTGSVYIPCDVRNSDERLSDIIAESQANFVFYDSTTAGRLSHLKLDAVQKSINLTSLPLAPVVSVENRAVESDLAFIMFTSGSTGKPKGIQITHENFLTHVSAATTRMGLGREAVLQQSALGYDASLAQIFYALGNGGRLIISSNRHELRDIASVIRDKRVTFTLMAPSEYSVLLEYGKDILSHCRDWRVVMCGGEAFPPHLRHSFEALRIDELKIFNAYGPTEISVASNIGPVPYRNIDSNDNSKIPIGPALPGYNVALVDETAQPVPLGWAGQIAVRGAAVSSGYINNAALNKANFLHGKDGEQPYMTYLTGDMGRMLPDGSLVYLGRMEADSQVKLRGIRIELNDIAQSIMATSDGIIANAAVGARGAESDAFLVAYVVFAAGKEPKSSGRYLSNLLRSLPLPVYMQPAQALPMDALPMTISGKLDMRKLNSLPLPEPVQELESAGAMTDVEQRLKRVWEDVLGHSGIRITKDANFFSSGGNSLLLIKLQAGIIKEFGVHVPLPKLFRESSLENLAVRLDRPATPAAEPVKTNVARTAPATIPVNWGDETAIGHHVRDANRMPGRSPLRRHPLTVILTGATGFLGRSIVQELQRRDDVLQIHCVAVRDTLSGTSRDMERDSNKVILHAGDLSLPYLGMMEDEARLLFEEADAIIHNGADVSFLKTYQSLRAANVESTKELVRLSVHRAVPFHFVSTAGVGLVAAGQDLIREASVRAHTPRLDKVDGYVASKWASEVYLENVQRHSGLAVHVYRPSNITGAGAPALDIMHNVLDFSRRIRAIPDLSGWRGYLDFISVQTAASRLVDSVVATGKATAGATGSQAVGAEFTHLSGEEVIAVAEAKAHMEKGSGYRFRVLSMDEWVREARRQGLHELVGAYLSTIGPGTYPSFPRLESRKSSEIF
ncbi:Nonribosomal peptide synthetase 14 [Beauveria bassiana]|nr:Nonribosomal peptide synthetase 14 [Beauveria bassiana]KAH8708333.1 PKS-NRPS hybrid synthetase psoA [Beauveria bassiana]